MKSGCIAAWVGSAVLLASAVASGQDGPKPQTASIMVGPNGDGVMIITDGQGGTTQTPIAGGVIGGGGARSISAMPGGMVTFGPDGKPQPMDINQIRQRQMDQLKDQLGSNDAEWAVLLPKIEKIQSLLSDAGLPSAKGAIAMTTAGSGSNGVSEVRQKQQALREATQNPAASESEIRQKITALRDARVKAREALGVARQELADLVTRRQEAVLIDRGYLD